MTAKTYTPEPTATPAAEPEKKVMGIERDDKNVRVSFTPDGNMMIITLPLGSIPRVLAHGFIYELHGMINDWYAERKKSSLILREEASKFSFKRGIGKLFK